MNELDEFFNEAHEDQEAHDENLRDFALLMLRNSSMRDDDDGLEEELIWGEISPQRWREIFERLKLNQLRVIDMPNWSQTEFNKSYKKNGIDN